MNHRHTKVLEWVILIVSLVLFATYNAIAIWIAQIIIEEGIVDIDGFYNSPKVVAAYEAFLFINCGFQIAISVTLLVATCRLVQIMRTFFKEQFRQETRMLMCVMITIIVVNIITLCNDATVTILQLNDSPFYEDDSDGLLIADYVVFIPSLLFNILHFANI